MSEDYIRALREERDACDRAGRTRRVEAIDAELHRIAPEDAGEEENGVDNKADAEKAEAAAKRAAESDPGEPKQRRVQPRNTTSG